MWALVWVADHNPFGLMGTSLKDGGETETPSRYASDDAPQKLKKNWNQKSIKIKDYRRIFFRKGAFSRVS